MTKWMMTESTEFVNERWSLGAHTHSFRLIKMITSNSTPNKIAGSWRGHGPPLHPNGYLKIENLNPFTPSPRPLGRGLIQRLTQTISNRPMLENCIKAVGEWRPRAPMGRIASGGGAARWTRKQNNKHIWMELEFFGLDWRLNYFFWWCCQRQFYWPTKTNSPAVGTDTRLFSQSLLRIISHSFGFAFQIKKMWPEERNWVLGHWLGEEAAVGEYRVCVCVNGIKNEHTNKLVLSFKYVFLWFVCHNKLLFSNLNQF